MQLGFVKDHLDMFRVALLKLPLQVSAAVLVFAKTIYFAAVVFKRVICKAGKLGGVSFSISARSDRLGRVVPKAVVPIGWITTRK